MASPGEKKGQRKGSCGHIMAAFDSHDKCARFRDKRIGEDNCVIKKPCSICDGFSDNQRELLATPSYRIRKDKKAGLLVSLKEVTVISSVVSTPVSAVKPVDSEQLVSETPFLAPATRPIGPVKVPVAVDAQVKVSSDEQKSKKKSHKSRKEESVSKDSSSKQSAKQSDKKRDSKTHRKHDWCKSTASEKASVTKQTLHDHPPADTRSGPETANQHGATTLDSDQPPTGQEKVQAGPSGQSSSGSHQPACAFPLDTQDTHFEQISEDDFDRSGSCSGSDEANFRTLQNHRSKLRT